MPIKGSTVVDLTVVIEWEVDGTTSTSWRIENLLEDVEIVSNMDLIKADGDQRDPETDEEHAAVEEAHKAIRRSGAEAIHRFATQHAREQRVRRACE